MLCYYRRRSVQEYCLGTRMGNVGLIVLTLSERSKFMSCLRMILALAVICVFTGIGSANVPESAFNQDPWPMAKEGPVKVFILAGQSNMQGHAALRTLEYLIYNEETAPEYQQWKDRWGDWYERSDVWIWTTDGERYGNLKPGFGQSERKIGPELGFGWVIGEAMSEQVLLIKTCWGGRSVKRDFLPPSAQMPPDEKLEKELENARKRNPDTTIDEIKERYGKAYRDMIKHVNDVLGNLKKLFPKYDEKRGCELAGFVWFQGWNDMVDREQRGEKYVNYTKRLAQLIKDVRKDLKAPNLPVVIGELGATKRGDFRAAQEAVAKLPEFRGNVKFVKTREFWEPEVEEMANKGVWKGPDWVKFYNVGSERGYHYLGSAKIYYQMGKAFGEGMAELLGE
ncbi:MAG: sialate O-acetylesterase [Planctomycetes bacterium]|nr:sialate O-acetylesterase [Planctomycetota bacterium]MCH8120861.1 sialate O-acetylesterase [Planctomycetota bacterium]